MSAALQVIHEDPELLVLNKPAGLACHPTKPDGFSSLISRVRTHLGEDAAPQKDPPGLGLRQSSGIVAAATED